MIKSKVFLALVICFLLALASPFTALAKSDKAEGKSNTNANRNAAEMNMQTIEVDEELTDEAETEEETEENAEETVKKPWVAIKNELEAQKDAAEAQKDLIEQQIEALKAQYEIEPGDALYTEIEELTVQKAVYFAEMRSYKVQMKSVMKEQYTEEEWDNLQDLAEELENQGLNTLPVTNVMIHKKNIKFDTPPVIKEGRILIPLRAISQATGATVTWDNDTKTITIVQDSGTEITLTIGDDQILVNDEVFTVDEPAQSINNRTVVPIRFIVESLNLDADWDAETQTLEVN